ncbi:hypothetical protein NK718_02565 [Alsobacter sp. SYSU M60028]|uniref:Uncharacterized protein n=1 Tax=Alsobacter ponti TaxID=2962936 RepID=A0ABT1L9G2_9HYPH|nr:hypothetical protein [Alsobacter ponti]MCP8937385.1 hypothetical protein [Alsobacter ponti]
MDLIVARGEERQWRLTDLLGRTMGVIVENKPGAFTIRPEGFAIEAMAGLTPGPYVSVDDALAAIERRTRGVCRRKAGSGNE